MNYIYFLQVVYFIFFFFFSSRRRHTRYIGDWSSDVCSSDLDPAAVARLQIGFHAGTFSNAPRNAAQQSATAVLAVSRTPPNSRKPCTMSLYRSEERRVGKEGRSRGSTYHHREERTRAGWEAR